MVVGDTSVCQCACPLRVPAVARGVCSRKRFTQSGRSGERALRIKIESPNKLLQSFEIHLPNVVSNASLQRARSGALVCLPSRTRRAPGQQPVIRGRV